MIIMRRYNNAYCDGDAIHSEALEGQRRAIMQRIDGIDDLNVLYNKIKEEPVLKWLDQYALTTLDDIEQYIRKLMKQFIGMNV